MKLIISFLPAFLLSCGYLEDHNGDKNNSTDKNFDVNPVEILKDHQTWYNYTYYNISLSQDFIGLNTDSSIIDKSRFLNSLLNDNTIALKVKLHNGIPVYKLYPLGSVTGEIASQSQHLAEMEIKNYQMEGKPVPSFNFTDINGMHYSNTSTKGKTIVLKCWFIGCVACVKEFPECNKLVKEYANKNNIVFISLAIDKKKELTAFLQKEPLSYATVPEAGSYISDSLNIIASPTHLIIDKNGIIRKVVNSLEELKPFLKREVENES
ncbi:MAG: TlpA disulfide reductase family protein [Agriterribacter sp.]